MSKCPNTKDGKHGFYDGLYWLPWPWFLILPIKARTKCLFCGAKK